LRFAVHRPGNPVASPRSHRMPCGDVPSRVYVCVAGVSAGGAPVDGLVLTRLRVHPPARRAALTRERGTDLLHSAGCFLLQASDEQAPPGHQDAAVQSGLLPDAPTRIGGRPTGGSGHVLDLEVLDLNQVEPPRDGRGGLLSPVLTSVGLAGAQRAMARFTPTRRSDPRRARANLRSSRRSLRRCRPSNLGACSRSPVERAADTATPRSIPTTWPFPGAATGAGTAAKATCQRPARSQVTR
jgi:hypothetical protein